MVDEALRLSFTHDVVLLKSLGVLPLIVHGGGPEVTRAMKSMGHESEFVEGLRVTSSDGLRITEMVLSGTINKELIAQINSQGGNAVGLSGKDANLIVAEKLVHAKGFDLGYVGDVSRVNGEILLLLLKNGFIPVISPIGMGTDGQTYNINADTVASRIAAEINAEKIIFMTNVDGVLEDDKLISSMTPSEAKAKIKSGVVSGGMIPKVEAMLFSMNHGVSSAHIINGKEQNAIISELFTDKGIGTIITSS